MLNDHELNIVIEGTWKSFAPTGLKMRILPHLKCLVGLGPTLFNALAHYSALVLTALGYLLGQYNQVYL